MWAASLGTVLHNPHGPALPKSLLGPQEHSRKTYPTQKRLILLGKGRFFANVQYPITPKPEFSHYSRLHGYVGGGRAYLTH